MDGNNRTENMTPSKEKYGVVNLTESGKNVADNIKSRYEVLKQFLQYVLGVDADIAAKDACQMEHIISSETVKRIDRQLERLYESMQNKDKFKIEY